MPKANFVQNNFTAGELSPKLVLRNDIKKYFQGVKTLENFILFPQGGITRTPGLRFVKEVKTSAKKTRLIPFVFSTTQAYMLEFGDQYIRVFKDNGWVDTAVVTDLDTGSTTIVPYLEADLFDLQVVQSADVLYIVHQNYAPRTLTRTSHTSWTLRKVVFKPPPTHEADTDISGGTTLTPGATTGNGVTFTVSGATAVFLAGDVGRFIKYNDALAEIKTVAAGGLSVTADILYAFPNTNPIATGSWLLQGSPSGFATCARNSPVGSTTTLTVYADETDTAGMSVFRSGTVEIGKYIKLWGGLLKITGYLFPYRVNVTILSELNAPNTNGAVVSSFRGKYTLEVDSWNDTYGYPGACSFFESRIWFAGSKSFPYRLWGSQTNNFVNMGIGYLDDDAIEYNIFNNQVNNILWLFPTESLFAGTLAGEFRATGGSDNPLTPDNVLVKNISTMGSKRIKPVQVANLIIFVQRGAKKLLETSYNFDADSYLPSDLTLLADHLLKDYTIIDIAYQQEPDRIVWVVRSDGTLLGLTLDKANDVLGWHRRITDGVIESVAVIPHPDGTNNQVWVIVKRFINGAYKRYIEYFATKSATAPDNDLYYNQMNVDSGLTYNGSPTNTVTGLSHLEGKTVVIVGDGAVYPSKVVTSGQVTLDGIAASKIEVGLPYTSKLITMRPELADRSIYNKKKKWNRLTISLLQTLGLTIATSSGSEDIPFRKGSDPMDTAPPLFDGDKDVNVSIAWSFDAPLTLTQTQPLPCTILGFVGNLDIGDL